MSRFASMFSAPRLSMQLVCLYCCCVVMVSGRARLALSTMMGGGFENGKTEDAHAWILRMGASTAAAALLAQLLLDWAPWRSCELEENTDPAKIWHEELGVSKLVPAMGYNSTTKLEEKLANRKFTMREVAKHNTIDDLWIVVDGRAYDITRFVLRHPGGVGPVINMAGKDCTDVFANYHAARVYKLMLPQYLVGEVTDVPVIPHQQDFRKVRQELLRRGLFETDYRFYGRLGAWLVMLFVGSLYLTLGCDSFSAHMWGATVMGVFWQQLAGLGHDLGHSGVTHNFHLDHQIGSVLTAFMGLSVCWWKSDHNTHHVVCNSVEHDPNIQHMPLLAVSKNMFESGPFYDTYHKKQVVFDAAARFLVSYQHIFFYPVMAVARVNLYIQGILHLLTATDTVHYRNLELCSLAAFASWLTYVVSSLPVGEKVWWVLLSHAVAGILHVQIVLSHWSMDIYKGHAYNGPEDEWYIMQLKTTMNVDTPQWLDFIHIGLQFQIEHHLFPRLPRHNLREARKLVKAVCKKYDLHYHEPGFFAGNLEMWRQLRDSAYAARKTEKADGGFYHSAIYEGLQMNG